MTWDDRSLFPPESKKPVQKPPHIPRLRITPIASPEQPETASILVLHTEIIPHRHPLPVTLPPFPGDAFRPIGVAHPVTHPPPGECDRRMIRQQRHRIDRLRRIEQPHRPRQIGRPAASHPASTPAPGRTDRSGTSLSTGAIRYTSASPNRLTRRSTSGAMIGRRLGHQRRGGLHETQEYRPRRQSDASPPRPGPDRRAPAAHPACARDGAHRAPGEPCRREWPEPTHPHARTANPAAERPNPARSRSPQTWATNVAITVEKASAVSSGSTNPSLAWIDAAGTTGTIGSNNTPAA